MADPLSPAFERLARDFLAGRASLRHDWRNVRSRLSGNRLDLVFQSPSPKVPEVFVSLNERQITVGAGKSHEDFEDFGRGLTDEQVAQRAFSRLIELLKEHGYISD
jgi:hypothetical protein